MKEKLHKVSAYLNQEEMKDFNRSVMARGAGQSGYIREMLGFEVRPRGAPKGPRKKRTPQAKAVKAKQAKRERISGQATANSRAPRLPFPE